MPSPCPTCALSADGPCVRHRCSGCLGFYLAPRFSQREEMQGYKADLEARGHRVYGRWIDDPYPATEDFILRHAEIAAPLALEDLWEIAQAATFIAFTEPPGASGRGGRHVELGYALARDKRVIVVGPHENIFHHLPGIRAYATWAEFLGGTGLEPEGAR